MTNKHPVHYEKGKYNCFFFGLQYLNHKTRVKNLFHEIPSLIKSLIFDSSYKRKKTYQFVLGRGKVIQGWDEGMQFFNKGSEGWLLIPSKLAYGPMAINEDDINIPGDSALAFKIKIIEQVFHNTISQAHSVHYPKSYSPLHASSQH